MLNLKTRFMIMACVSGFLLGGCSTHHLPLSSSNEGGLTVSQLYHQSVDETDETPIPHYHLKPVNYDGYTRTAANETTLLFKPLDNPSIPLYVYPHVAQIGDEQILKPGFTTAFFLYKQNQYALASEEY